MAFRSSFVENSNLAGFTSNQINEIGAMVINSSKGGLIPIKCQSEKDVLLHFGNPSANYPEVFEAIAYCRKAPAWIVSAIGSGSLYGGVDVETTTVTPFTVGRDYDTFDYSTSYPNVSHSFFSVSPQVDDLAVSIKYVSGTKYQMSLYEVLSSGNSYITYYDYSLSREKDGFGRSLYYEDVFNNDPYVKIKVNANWVSGTITLPGSTVYAFNGGTRGDDPSTGDYTIGWANFQKVNKYKSNIIMDCTGENATTINSLVTNYQKWAHAITCIPLGYSATEAVIYRNSLGINSDKISLYTNWAKIQDDYNNSMAWISHVGSIGGKYAMMYNAYDAASPAGIDENGWGGILSDWKVIEMENDYTDFDRGLGSDLQVLDEAQINPLVFTESDGLLIYGDKTLQSTNNDTSFIGTRRLYNFIDDTVQRQILKLQEFKVNDSLHRLRARTMATTFLEPILNAGWIREFYVLCDESNNTDSVLDRREFVMDIYIKVMPNSQFCKMTLRRVSQSTVISSLLQGTAPA
jgi:hypothetical protein